MKNFWKPISQIKIKYIIFKKKLDIIQLKRIELQPKNFELIYKIFKSLTTRREFQKSFTFIKEYIKIKYLQNNSELMYNKNNFSNEIKILSDEYLLSGSTDYHIKLLLLAVKIVNDEPLFYSHLYDVYKKNNMYLEAIKSLLLYIYYTNFNTDQYLELGELFEKEKLFWHSFLCYYRYFKETNDRKILLHINKNIIDHLKNEINLPMDIISFKLL
jgi:hypothetical protein